jgi:hypothetical protein
MRLHDPPVENVCRNLQGALPVSAVPSAFHRRNAVSLLRLLHLDSTPSMFKPVASSLLIFIARFSGAVDIPIEWTIQDYEPITAQSGDTITFTWEGSHNAFIHPTGTCDGEGAIEVGSTSPAQYTFTDADVGTSLFFACQVGGHCDAGQQIIVDVQALLVEDTTESIEQTESNSTTDSTETMEPTENISNSTMSPMVVCYICLEGYVVSTPDAIVNVPTQPPQPCSFYDTAGLGGLLKADQCPLLQTFTTAACGCVLEGTPTAAPVDQETAPPAASAVAYKYHFALIATIISFVGAF